MKHYIIAIVVAMLALTFTVKAQQTKTESKSKIEYTILKEQYQKLLDQQVKLEGKREHMIRDLKNEREKYLNFIETIISIFTSMILILGSVAVFFGWNEFKKIRKDIEQKTTELLQKERERLENEAKEKLKCYSNEIILNISKLIERNPASIKDLINQKISDYEAKQNNPICLYHTEGDGIDKQLKIYDFQIIETYEIKAEEEPKRYCSFQDASVVFIANPYSEDKDASDFCSNLKQKVNEDGNYFYLGKSRFDAKVHFSNCASTPITIEHNLLDLLRYIEFKKSTDKA
jgi:hypothetical protein